MQGGLESKGIVMLKVWLGLTWPYCTRYSAIEMGLHCLQAELGSSHSQAAQAAFRSLSYVGYKGCLLLASLWQNRQGWGAKKCDKATKKCCEATTIAVYFKFLRCVNYAGPTLISSEPIE